MLKYRLVYSMLSVLYGASCIGLDPTLVSALVALGYATLALTSRD